MINLKNHFIGVELFRKYILNYINFLRNNATQTQILRLRDSNWQLKAKTVSS